MANSVFRDFSTSPERLDGIEDENLKIDKNLVIVVNKDGKVSVDERTLHSLLANETNDTSVTIVQVASPTESMNEAMDEEDKNMTDLELLETLGEGLEEKKEGHPSRIGLTVAEFYPANEARQFAEEVLNLAGINHPNSIDFEFQRFVIQNDHCYTNLTAPAKLKPVPKKIDKVDQSEAESSEPERSVRQRKPTVKVLESSVLEKEIFKDDASIKSGGSDDFEVSGSDYANETSVSSEELDHESDLDFNINQANKPPKKRKNKKKLKKQPLPKKSKKEKVEGVEKERAEKIKPLRKSISKGKQPPTEKIPEPEPIKDVEPEPEPVKKEDIKPKIVKKERKNFHSDALLLDMTTLFSQPDKIIRHEKPSTSKGFVSLTSKEKLPGTISVQTAPTMDTSAALVSSLSTEQNKPFDLIDAIVSKELGGLPDSAIPDTALLDTLGDALSDDFLNELAGNKELQEIIDKQVLGSFDPSPVVVSEIRKIMPAETAPILIETPVTTPEAEKKTTQVIRPDGRVITLPPIEVPTTRAKKKKDEEPVTPTVAPEPKKVKSRKKSKDKSTSRRNSSARSSTETRRDSTTRRKRPPNQAVLAAVLAEKDTSEEDEPEEEAVDTNSEDDPNRLWCTCRKPHGGRFMICCDICADWFHGKCVGITKAMGTQMEESGKEWTCPNCLKKKKEREQPRITNFLAEDQPSKSTPVKSCIVCKKTARPSTVYCSDECIIKHAQKATKSDVTTSTPKYMKSKNNRVIVLEKMTGRCITGDKAPTPENLNQWLKEHPTFEAVSPGTVQSKAILAKQKQLKEISKKIKDLPPASPQPSTVQTTLKFSPGDQKLVIAKDRKSSSGMTPKTTPKPSTSKMEDARSTPKSAPPKEVKKKPIPKVTSTAKTGAGGSDQWRSNVRKTLNDQLLVRTQEIVDPKAPRLTVVEIDKFCEDIEKEMFELFNRDIGQKYKSKYRSLMFNIKDPKNLTLFKKISEKAVQPYRLVRMEPHELASQELTQWRENESKHSLELIKKSELELLAASKNYVLKTHKGEEVVEGKSVDRVELDPSVAVEDVVSILNNATVSSSTNIVPTPKEYGRSYSHDDPKGGNSKKDSKHRARSRSRERDRHGKSSKHKRRHSRERSKERRGSRDRHHKTVRRSPERKHDKAKDKKEKKLTTTDHNKKIEDYNLIDKILEASQAILSSGRLDVEKIEREAAEAAAASRESSEEKVQPDSDQEPTSTVTIPTPPHAASPVDLPHSFWSGTINIIDLAKFEIDAQAVSGDCESIADHIPSTLNVVGRIQPATVWDYIGKIRKSPGKEIIVIRFSSLDEANYLTLYLYYQQKGRLGVVKSTSNVIKDFYILPLAAGQKIPTVLQPFNGPGFVEGDQRPNTLLGVIVKVKAPKRSTPAIVNRAKAIKTEVPLLPPIITKKSLENIDSSFSKEDEIVSTRKRKSASKLLSLGLPKTNDDDEPYSPGGDSDDEDLDKIPAAKPTPQKGEGEDLTKAVDEINRQIEARRLEIASMLGTNPEELDEPYSPSRPVTPPAGTSTSENSSNILSGLDSIAIPSNLSEILASIKGASSASSAATAIASAAGMDPNEEYDPTTTIEGTSYYQSAAQFTSSYKASNETKTATTSSPTVSEKAVLDVDEEMNEDDCFEIPDDDGVTGADDPGPTKRQRKSVQPNQ